MPRMGLAEHRRSARAREEGAAEPRRPPQRPALRLWEGAVLGSRWLGCREREPSGWGRVWRVTDRDLEMQTDSGRERQLMQ